MKGNSLEYWIKTNLAHFEQPCVIITCGKAFSGKSYMSLTLAKNVAAEVLSYDQIWNQRRQMVDSDDNEFLKYEEIINYINFQALDILASNKSVIIDTLFNSRDSRESIRTYFVALGFEVITIYCKVSNEIQSARIFENQKTKLRHPVDPVNLKFYNEQFEEPEDESNLFVYKSFN